MSLDPNCPRCGSPLATDGVCARCELALALEHPLASIESLESPELTLKRFGDYELLEELGHGGMGVVYKARHIKLNRTVALKMLLLGQFSSESSVERFQREAQAAAALHHPNIVSVYDVGQVEGQHYFTMEYVEGRSLASILRDGPLRPAQAAAYCLAIAEAIGAAHAAGILHRDLKPSNILIDPCFDRPFITDFGLAKRFTESQGSVPSSELTVTGQILGSPNYLAPELAAGKLGQVGPSSDLFSIGAMLYECLTGRPPFIAATLQETLLRIRDTEPVAPRTLISGVPRDLETICLKCLQKEPSRRYATAQELAEDLKHFLDGEPITARPVGPTARLWRWCRRKPLVASLVVALHLAFGLGLAGVLWQWRRAELNAADEARERRRAEAGELSARLNQYVSDMNLVQQAWDGGNVKRAQTLLKSHIPKPGQADLRGFEWRYLWKLCQDQSRITFTNFPGGVSLAISPDGKLAAAASDPAIKLLDFVNGKELDTLTQPGVNVLAFSPKAPNILAAGAKDGTIKLWNLGARQSLASLSSNSNIVRGVAFSPDGKLLASTTEQSVTLWDVQNRTSLWTRPTPTYTAAVSFAPDGQSLVTGGGERFSLIVWELENGDYSTFPAEHTGWIEVAAFSPDGKRARMIPAANAERDNPAGRIVSRWDTMARLRQGNRLFRASFCGQPEKGQVGCREKAEKPQESWHLPKVPPGHLTVAAIVCGLSYHENAIAN